MAFSASSILFQKLETNLAEGCHLIRIIWSFRLHSNDISRFTAALGQEKDKCSYKEKPDKMFPLSSNILYVLRSSLGGYMYQEGGESASPSWWFFLTGLVAWNRTDFSKDYWSLHWESFFPQNTHSWSPFDLFLQTKSSLLIFRVEPCCDEKHERICQVLTSSCSLTPMEVT